MLSIADLMGEDHTPRPALGPTPRTDGQVLSCLVPGRAVGKGRPRVSTQHGKVRTYTPEQTVKAENWARACWMDAHGHTLLEGALDVAIVVTVEVPASWSKVKRARALAGKIRPGKKPDTDNIAKLYLDGLNGVAWFDDAQIVELRVSKFYGEAPSVVIDVRDLGPMP